MQKRFLLGIKVHFWNSNICNLSLFLVSTSPSPRSKLCSHDLHLQSLGIRQYVTSLFIISEKLAGNVNSYNLLKNKTTKRRGAFGVTFLCAFSLCPPSSSLSSCPPGSFFPLCLNLLSNILFVRGRCSFMSLWTQVLMRGSGVFTVCLCVLEKLFEQRGPCFWRGWVALCPPYVCCDLSRLYSHRSITSPLILSLSLPFFPAF